MDPSDDIFCFPRVLFRQAVVTHPSQETMCNSCDVRFFFFKAFVYIVPPVGCFSLKSYLVGGFNPYETYAYSVAKSQL